MAPPPVLHRYFVSYAHAGGFGCTDLSLTKPIRGMSDIEVVSRLIGERVGGTTPIVLFFALLDRSE